MSWVFQIKTRAKNAKMRPAVRGRFSAVKNVNSHLQPIAKINTQERKKEKNLLKSHFYTFYICSILFFKQHLFWGWYLIFANFPSFGFSAKMPHFAKESWNPSFGSRLCLYLTQSSQISGWCISLSSLGLRSPPGLCSETTCNSFHIPGNKAITSSYSVSLGEPVMWILISLNYKPQY